MNTMYLDPFWHTFGVAVVAIFGIVIALLIIHAGNKALKNSKTPKFLIVMAIAAIAYAGAKPKIEWPKGVQNNHSEFDTNNWAYVDIKWDLGTDYPLDIPFQIEAQPIEGADYWTSVGNAYSGDYEVRIAATVLGGNPTNYKYRVLSDYDPGIITIKDLFASANTNNLSVICKWTCPKEMDGKVGKIMYRIKDDRSEWKFAKAVTMTTGAMEVTLIGNFVNRRLDREFCIVVDGYQALMMRNMVDSKLRVYRTLNFHLITMPLIKDSIKHCLFMSEYTDLLMR